MKKYILLLLIIWLFIPVKPKGMDTIGDDLEYDEIQSVIDDVLHNEKVDFYELTKDLVSGKNVFSPSGLIKKLLGYIVVEVNYHKNTLGKIISIVLLSAIFTNISLSFKNEQVSETGYYVIYLLLLSILLTTFIGASNIAKETVESIIIFMKALVPTYIMAVGLSAGSASGVVFYEIILITISFAEIILIKLIIPLINVYLIIMLVNNFTKEDMLSKFAELLITSIKWILNSFIGAVVGINAIQGMIAPMVDKVKRLAIIKASKAIPGVGGAVEGVTETILGTSLLLKNSIGVVGMVIIILISVVPLIKLGVIVMIYKLCAAVLQPISDKRIINSISASSRSSFMLLQAVFVGMFLFVLAITIVTVSTMK